MKEEIEAAALFITRLVNKNLSGSSDVGSSASSTHSSASSSSSTSSASSSSSESPPGFDEHTTIGAVNGNDQDKVEQFRQCLTKALYERFRNHWFPEQPSKGQAYRCIRLNEWDRHDITLQKACLQCGIDYKDLQLPVELTLWVDPEEVTCRFGEAKGSHCLVAKFKDGELKDNNFNIDINNIDIEIFRQAANSTTTTTTTTDRMWSANFHGSPDYNKQHNHQQSLNGHSMNNNHNSSYQFIHHNQQHHQQAQIQHQVPPHQQHNQRSNISKPAIINPYHHNYLNGCDNNGNPISYYYF